MATAPRKTPTPADVLTARAAAGLTQTQAAEMVHLGSFKRWSEHERGISTMDPARWELFLIKLGRHELYKPVDTPEPPAPPVVFPLPLVPDGKSYKPRGGPLPRKGA